jgi:hypothetical protein
MSMIRAGWRDEKEGRRRWRRVTTIAAVVVLATATVAWASATVSTTGSTASYNSPTNEMSVTDTLVDGDTAYSLHCWSNNSQQTSCANPVRRENHNGAGSTVVFDLSPGGSRIVFRACRAKTFNPDNCSSYVNTGA